MMAKQVKQFQDFKTFVLEQLSALPDLMCKAMFGGYGLYSDTHFFGILHKGRLYFKTDDTSSQAYLAYNMTCFCPNEKQTLKHYFEVPVTILEDTSALLEWAQQAIQVQKSSAS